MMMRTFYYIYHLYMAYLVRKPERNVQRAVNDGIHEIDAGIRLIPLVITLWSLIIAILVAALNAITIWKHVDLLSYQVYP